MNVVVLIWTTRIAMMDQVGNGKRISPMPNGGRRSRAPQMSRVSGIECYNVFS